MTDDARLLAILRGDARAAAVACDQGCRAAAKVACHDVGYSGTSLPLAHAGVELTYEPSYGDSTKRLGEEPSDPALESHTISISWGERAEV